MGLGGGGSGPHYRKAPHGVLCGRTIACRRNETMGGHVAGRAFSSQSHGPATDFAKSRRAAAGGAAVRGIGGLAIILPPARHHPLSSGVFFKAARAANGCAPASS